MSKKKQQVKKIFDSIAFRYDFLNHLLSFGFDYYWRRKALKLTGLNSSSVLLDIACGTGDVAIEAKKQGAGKIFGADFSFNMLRLFNQKNPWIKGNNMQMVAERPSTDRKPPKLVPSAQRAVAVKCAQWVHAGYPWLRANRKPRRKKG